MTRVYELEKRPDEQVIERKEINTLCDAQSKTVWKESGKAKLSMKCINDWELRRKEKRSEGVNLR